MMKITHSKPCALMVSYPVYYNDRDHVVFKLDHANLGEILAKPSLDFPNSQSSPPESFGQKIVHCAGAIYY